MSEVGDRYVQICQAAKTSKTEAKKTAIHLDVGRREMSRIQCNGISLFEFAKLHSSMQEKWSIATVQ